MSGTCFVTFMVILMVLLMITCSVLIVMRMQ